MVRGRRGAVRGWLPVVARPNRWGRLALRCLSILLAVAMLLTIDGESVWASTTAPTPPTPHQSSGSAAGLSHRSNSAVTKSQGGAAPVTPSGAAAESTTHTSAATPHLSNTAQTATATATAPRVRTPSVSTGKEILGDRTATRSVYQDSDGSLTAHVYARPVHYYAADGSWTDINTALKSTGGRWGETADSATATFAANGNDPAVVSVPVAGGGSVGFGLQGAANVAGVVSGSSITYPGVQPNADATYLATASGGVKETLVLRNANAPATWVFPLSLHGLTPSMTADGGVVFTNASGQAVDTIAHGFMRDSNIDPHSGDGVLSTGVTYSLITVDGSPALQVSLDSAWLRDPARVFPVNVDPSVQNVNTSGSTYVMSPYNNDYSSDSQLDVGTYDSGANIANSYLTFNVGATLPNAYTEAASLNLDETWSYSCQARPVWVSPILNGWSATGNKTYPWVSYGGAIGTGNFAAGYSGCGAAWQTIDLGDNPSAAGVQLIESWAHGGANNGLALTASTTDSYGWKKFDSKNSQYPPFLSITYSPYGADYSVPGNYTQPTGISAGSEPLTITNRGNSTWTVGNETLSYKLFNSADQLVSSSASTALPYNVAPNSSVTMTGTIAPVTPGQYYICWDMHVGSQSFFDSYGVPTAPCQTINSADTSPQIDSLSPHSNTTIGTLTPQLFATGHDPDNYPGTGITYQFQVYSVSSDGGDPELLVDSGQLPSGNYVVPAGSLAWNKEYYWTARDYDGLGYSPWLNPSYLSTAVPQPLITSHLGSAGSSRDFDPGVGDYTTSATDAAVSVVGPALAVTRSYNSLDPRTSNLFGAGWSTVYDMAAVPDGDGSGDVVVTYPDGHTVRFGLDPDGTTFSPPQGTYATFQTVPTGGYSLTARGGSTYLFTTQAGDGWKLSSITDSDGRVETLAYDGAGHLTTVTNAASSRSLSFSWAGGHVTSVATDPVSTGGQALTWTYGYSNDELTGVCAPDSGGKCTGYTYSGAGNTAGSLYRPMVLDAQPAEYWRLADSSGDTATDEVAANLGTDNGTYHNVNLGGAALLPGSPTSSTWFNGQDSNVTLPNNLVASSSYLSVQLWFETLPDGGPGVLFSTGHSAIGDENPSTGSMPVLYIGTDGKLYGQFWTGSVDPIVSANPVNDSGWHQVTLVGQGNSQSMYLDGQLVGSVAGQIANLDPMDFVGAGYVNNLAWVNGPAQGWSYDTGNIAEVAFYTHPLGGPAIAQQYAAAATAQDKIVSVTTPNGATAATVAYDDVTDRATSVRDLQGGTWSIANPTTSGSEAGYRGAVLGSGPNDFWTLADTTGVQAVNEIPAGSLTVDTAHQVNSDGDATYNNVTLGVAGPFPNTGATAAGFNGTSSSVSVPGTHSGSDAGTIGLAAWAGVGLWFNTTTPGSVLAEFGGTPLLYVGTDGKLYGGFTGGEIASHSPVTDGKWHFAVLAAGVNDANEQNETVYLDGAAIRTAAGNTVKYNTVTLKPFTIGDGAISGVPAAPTGNPNGYFTGSIADVAIFNNILSASAINGMYQAA